MNRLHTEPMPQRAAVFALLLGISVLSACGASDEDPDGGGGSGGLSLGGAISGSAMGVSSGTGAMSSEGGESSSGEAGKPSSNGGSVSGGSGGMTFFLPCESEADCKVYGGGKVCCDGGSMKFCTKPSACPGNTLP